MGLRLQHRIVIPFILIALATTAAAAWVALSTSADALRARVQAQLMSAASVAARSDFALNPAIVQSMRQVLGADIVATGPDGQILASSFSDSQAPLAAAVARAVANEPVSLRDPIVVDVECGAPCLVVYKRFEDRLDSGVALIADTSELVSTTRSVARTILGAAALSIIVMVLVSQAVVRRVTLPLDRLVRFARDVNPETQARAAVGNDEIGALAEAFNGMLDRLSRSQEALVRSEKLGLAGLFAARVAHDIRNPMSAIKMQTQLVKARHRGDGDTVATLDSVLSDINQVESVIKDLLELARPGELTRLEASVNAVVQDALQQLAAQFTHRRIVVVTDWADDLPPLRLDTSRLKQALLNVLVNASEALPTGGQITVSTGRTSQGGIEIGICDDGIGVEAAVIDKVFDPFVSTKRDGVGLGLVNAKAIVEGHGGTIRLSPRQPKGVCVTITLPGENHG